MTGDLDTLLDGPARDVAAAVAAGEVGVVELVEHAVERLDGAPAGTFVCTDPRVARREARALEDRLARGERPALAGVVAAHKDLFDTADFDTTYGHPALAGRPDRDATAVARARAAGIVQVGKANLHEVAFGVTGTNPHTGDTTHPTHPHLMPGGSSTGSAAGVASHAVGVSLGTDTGGSVRIPAACCGVVGVKATRGAVPTTGVLALSWLQDTVGALARTVEDAAVLLAAVAGPDGEDPAARTAPEGWLDAPAPGTRPAWLDRAGTGGGAPRAASLYVPRELWDTRVHPEVAAAGRRVVDGLADGGAQVREVGLPRFADARRAQATLLAAHALAAHAEHLRERPDSFGDDVRSRLERAKSIDGATVARALRTRERWMADLESLLGPHDAVVCPTLAMPPPPTGATTISWPDGEEPVTPALTRLTGVWNLAGLPAVSVPCGTVQAGLPVAFQLVGLPWSEPSLLGLAAAVERMHA